MTTQQFTAEEIFKAALEAIRKTIEDYALEVNKAEQRLGRAVVDHRAGDHSGYVEAVRIADAKLAGAVAMSQIAHGYWSGTFVPRKKAEE